MPRVETKTKIKLGAERSCGRCGDAIKPGDQYKQWKFRYGGPRYRCMKFECRPRPSDLTQSKMSQVYAAQESAEDVIDGLTFDPEEGDFAEVLEQISEAVRAAAEEVRGVAEEYADAAEAMGEAGYEMQDKADELTGWADELDDFEPDVDPEGVREEEQIDSLLDQAKEEADDLLMECPV